MNESDDEYGDLDETSIFQALNDHYVEYGVVGGSAAMLGNPRLRIEGVDDEAATGLSKQLLHPDFFARTAASTWRTDTGSIDVLGDIPGTDGQPVAYAELRARAIFAPTHEIRIPLASLDDIINSKDHADHPKDREALPELRELRRQLFEVGTEPTLKQNQDQRDDADL